MKLLVWSLVTLLSAGLAVGRALADVRPPPGSFLDHFAGLGTLISATILTTGFILAGLWLARKIRGQK